MLTKIPTALHLANEYRELNGIQYEVLETPPSALHFSRLVHISRPVLIKGFSIPATGKWSQDYLIKVMGEHEISVAATPAGQGADALAPGPGGKAYFAEPHTEIMSMRSFLARLSPSAQPQRNSQREALYLQSQNGNLYPGASSEFSVLLPDVPSELCWASTALGREPEAVNIWIGDSGSVTSVHCDPYENIYTVITGAKHFTLFPPTEGFCLKERVYPHARYTRQTPSSSLTLMPSGQPSVRWSSVRDPTTAPAGSAPMHITVHTGEALYLPPGWWHHVRQTGLCIAVNWWYDMEMRGMNYLWLNFLRGEPETEEDSKVYCEMETHQQHLQVADTN